MVKDKNWNLIGINQAIDYFNYKSGLINN